MVKSPLAPTGEPVRRRTVPCWPQLIQSSTRGDGWVTSGLSVVFRKGKVVVRGQGALSSTIVLLVLCTSTLSTNVDRLSQLLS
jgi:hypothetical protein